MSNQLCLALGTPKATTKHPWNEFPDLPPPTFAPTWQARMSGQHVHADAVPSPTLVGEGSVDYTHVCIMVGHDDDVVLDPRLFASRPRNAKSRWEGQQSDMAIAQSMLAQFPQLRATFARTNEDLLATDAKVMLCADTNVRGRWAAAHRGAGQLGPG